MGLFLFLYLQLVDTFTTSVGLARGLSEANPIVGVAVTALDDVFLAVLLIKVPLFAFGVYASRSGRDRLLHITNSWFAAVAVWNAALLVF
jgi:hypothetical protein